MRWTRCFLLITAVLLLAATPSRGQAPEPAGQAVYLELLGHGGLYSFNYERVLQPRVHGRVGVSLFSASAVDAEGTAANADVVLAPLTASYLRGGTHHLELGGGGLLGYASAEVEDVGGGSGVLFGVAGLAGYRYQRPEGGLLLRLAYTPLLSGGTFSNWFGLALGYAF